MNRSSHRATRGCGALAAIAAAALTIGAGPAGAQTRRALLVGINHYAPPTRQSRALNAGRPADSVRGPIADLQGAVNDVRAMRGVLVGRYGYDSAQVRTIVDSAATRAGIIREIEALGERSQAGDFIVFYYAGHGSEQRNSKTREKRGLDQTIVPYDANLTGKDIRDKEIARLFNRLIDRGLKVTLIFDSCHSGSVARSPLSGASRARWAPYNPVDAADGDTAPPPETRGALVLSASQDYELAEEMLDEQGAHRGAFTSALVSVLLAQAPNAPATRTFAQARAILRADGRQQEPVLQGSAERTRRALLIPDDASVGSRIVATIQRVVDDTTVEIDGGPATGLTSGAELRPLDAARAGERLRVEGAMSATRSLAVHSGSGTAKAGDLYALERLPMSSGTGVSVWMSETSPSDAELAEIAAALDALARRTDVEWIPDPSAVSATSAPSVTLRYSQGGWELHGALDTARLGAHPTAADLAAAALKLGNGFRRTVVGDAQRAAQGRVRVSALLPPPARLAKLLRPAADDTLSSIRFVRSAADANYLLVGRPIAGRIEYAWMRPGASRETATLSTLPARTKWLGGADSVRAERLIEDASTLARVRSWLMLESPPGGPAFPYHLAFRSGASKRLTTTGPFRGGEPLMMVLLLDSAAKTDNLKPRRVYLFSIAVDGAGAPLFPAEEGNNGNIVPTAKPGRPRRWDPEIPFPDDPIDIGEPYGLDTYIMITVPASESIPLDLLSWGGVRAVPLNASPLAKLLYQASRTTRRGRTIVPTDWSIERLSIPSIPPGAGH